MVDFSEKVRRLKNDADIASVISYLGIPTVRKGSAIFIRCPNPDHEDSHISNCYFKKGWHNVYCAACGKSTGAIDIIMSEKCCDFNTALSILCQIEGEPFLFDVKDNNNNYYMNELSVSEKQYIGVDKDETDKRILKQNALKKLKRIEETESLLNTSIPQEKKKISYILKKCG